jgi:hypothetical protein
VVLYELLTTKLPFPVRESSYWELFESIRKAQPIPLESHVPGIDPGLDAITRRCLAARPEDRFANGTEVADALEDWAASRLRTGPATRIGPVFISFSHRDLDAVERRIVNRLEQRGIQTWYSRQRISGAEEWERSIREGLESCPWFSVALSPNALASKWVKAEVHWALTHREGRVLPILLEVCDPGALHLMLPTIQHVDLSRDDDHGVRALLASFAR